jgi:hypothetical protein
MPTKKGCWPDYDCHSPVIDELPCLAVKHLLMSQVNVKDRALDFE